MENCVAYYEGTEGVGRSKDDDDTDDDNNGTPVANLVRQDVTRRIQNGRYV